MEIRPLAEVRQDLSRFIEEAVTTHARFDITRNGKRSAVLLSADDYDSLLETLAVLADADLVQQVHESLTSDERGVPVEEAYAEFKARRSHGTA